MAEYSHTAETAERWNPTAVGDQLEGVFEGLIAFDDAGNDVEPDEDGAMVYVRIVDEDDHALEVSASFQLRKAFDHIEPGTQCRITFTGEIPSTKPGRSGMKKYRVEW